MASLNCLRINTLENVKQQNKQQQEVTKLHRVMHVPGDWKRHVNLANLAAGCT
jgi:hypothetical protein